MGLPGRPSGNADNLRAGARAWDHLAWEIWHLNRPVERHVEALFEGWSGAAADGYRSRWEEVRRGLGEFDHRLHTVADRLRVLAGHIEDAQSNYDHLLGAAGIATAAGIGLTVLTLGTSDLLAAEADSAVAATVSAMVADFELIVARMAALMDEAAELLGSLGTRFAVDFAVVAPRLAYGPAGGAIAGSGLTVASGDRDVMDVLMSGALGAAENAEGFAHEEPAETGAEPRLTSELQATPTVDAPRLQNILDNLYKGTTNPRRIGSGTTMDAIRNELEIAEPTNGTWHLVKGAESARGLANWLARNGDASLRDRLVAQSILDELVAAFRSGGGFPR